MENKTEKDKEICLTIQLKVADRLVAQGYTPEEASLMAFIPEVQTPERDEQVKALFARGPINK